MTAPTLTRDSADVRFATPSDVSVVIVSWNTRDLLRQCLESLFTGGLDGLNADVWVVDNASGDGSAAMVQRDFEQVRLLPMGENAGFARANNAALRQAAGRYFLLLNSDTIVPPGSLAPLVAALDTCPDAAVASPLLLNRDGTPQFCWSRFPGFRSELRGELDRSQSPYPLVAYAKSATRAQMQPFAVDWVGGACFLVRASDTETVGLLDEGYFMYAEETDWCARFKQAGKVTLLVPAVAVMHLGGQSSKAVPVQTRQRMYRSNVRLFRHLYGSVGGLFPSALSLARYAAFRVRHALKGSGR